QSTRRDKMRQAQPMQYDVPTLPYDIGKQIHCHFMDERWRYPDVEYPMVSSPMMHPVISNDVSNKISNVTGYGGQVINSDIVTRNGPIGQNGSIVQQTSMVSSVAQPRMIHSMLVPGQFMPKEFVQNRPNNLEINGHNIENEKRVNFSDELMAMTSATEKEQLTSSKSAAHKSKEIPMNSTKEEEKKSQINEQTKENEKINSDEPKEKKMEIKDYAIQVCSQTKEKIELKLEFKIELQIEPKLKLDIEQVEQFHLNSNFSGVIRMWNHPSFNDRIQQKNQPPKCDWAQMSKEKDDLSQLKTKMCEILNKITPEKFHVLSEQIQSVSDWTEDSHLTAFSEIIFIKAVDELLYQSMYIEILLRFYNKNPKIFLKICIVCQKSFKKVTATVDEDYQRIKKLIEDETDEKEKLKLETELLYRKEKIEERRFGIMKFVGVLTCKKFFLFRIFEISAQTLLVPDSNRLNCLCKILHEVGKNLDMNRDKDVANSMRNIYNLLRSYMSNKDIEQRVQYAIMDLLDRRKMGWKDDEFQQAKPKPLPLPSSDLFGRSHTHKNSRYLNHRNNKPNRKTINLQSKNFRKQ
ncbi:hypothetical protein SNEBB_003646, partial [Seison nebaliae]